MKESVLLFLLLIWLHCCRGYEKSQWTDSIYSSNFGLDKKKGNNYISVTSFKFNLPGQKPSPWVDYLLGKQSVNVHYKDILDNNKHLPHSPPTEWCSAEMIGFLPRINNRKELSITRQDVSQGAGFPYLNNSKLELMDLHPAWSALQTDYRGFKRPVVTAECYYRFHERDPNPRKSKHERYVIVDYVFFYCPIPQKMCDEFIYRVNTPRYRKKGNFDAVLFLNLGTGHLKPYHSQGVKFKVNILDKYKYAQSGALGPAPQPSSALSRKNKRIGVCIISPYHPADTALKTVNRALLLESIRYYSLLGFHIALYDRDGGDAAALFDPNYPYAKAQNITISEYKKFHYYNYTVFGLMDIKSHVSLSIDNPTDKSYDGSMSREVKYADDDKVATSSHCRFEFNAVHDMDEVLVIDSDEYLYCAQKEGTVPAIAEQKKTIVNAIFQPLAEQVLFMQLTPSNRTKEFDNPRACLLHKIMTQRSVFECYATTKAPIRIHSTKAFYRSLQCPLTSYHTACAVEYNDVFYQKKQECYCKTFRYKTRCQFIHLQHNNYASQFWSGQVTELKKKKYWLPLHMERHDQLNTTTLELFDMMTNLQPTQI